MKAIVKTTGQFELMDGVTREFVGNDRPYLVKWSSFFEARTGAGQIKILHSGLPDVASDKDFQGYLAEAGNEDLAVAAYVSEFEAPAPAPEPAPKPKRKKAAAQSEEE